MMNRNTALTSFQINFRSFLVLIGFLCSFSCIQAKASLQICSVFSGISSGNSAQFSVFTGVSPQNQNAALIFTAFSGTGKEKLDSIFMSLEYDDPPGITWKEMNMNTIMIPFVLSNLSIDVELQVADSRTKPHSSTESNAPLPPFLFSFLSYVANAPVCFIPLTPEIPFRASIPAFIYPTTIQNGKHAFVYFSVTLPSMYNSVNFTVMGNPTPSASIFFIKDSKGTHHPKDLKNVSEGATVDELPGKNWLMYKSGDAIPGLGTMEFAYTPDLPYQDAKDQSLCEVEITVEYLNTTHTAAPIPFFLPESTRQGNTQKNSRSRFPFFIVFCILFALYLVVAYYNFTVCRERRFPFMFPFVERIYLFLSTFGFLSVTRPQYHDLDARI